MSILGLGATATPPTDARTVEGGAVRTTASRLRWAAAVLAALIVGWLLFWSIDTTAARHVTLSPHLTLVERIRVERSAFSLAGGHGAYAALPIPSRTELVTAQQVLRDGKPVWTGSRGTYVWYEEVGVFPSPDERLLVLEARGEPHPLVIHDLSSGRETIVPEPDAVRARKLYGYQPQFLEWAADSQAFFTFTDELDLGDEFETWTRSVWKVSIPDGNSTLDRQCVDKFPRDPDRAADWSRTACAGPNPPAGARN